MPASLVTFFLFATTKKRSYERFFVFKTISRLTNKKKVRNSMTSARRAAALLIAIAVFNLTAQPAGYCYDQ
jgi:hypothetical protein